MGRAHPGEEGEEGIAEREYNRKGLVFASASVVAGRSWWWRTVPLLSPVTVLSPPTASQAGAGVVADSVPEKEFEETVNKAAALGRAVDLAEQAFGAQ